MLSTIFEKVESALALEQRRGAGAGETAGKLTSILAQKAEVLHSYRKITDELQALKTAPRLVSVPMTGLVNDLREVLERHGAEL
jgi:hypothetical protein